MIRRRRSKRNTALFKLFRPSAVEFRGTLLYGGEVMFLGMPLYWAAVESIVKDIC